MKCSLFTFYCLFLSLASYSQSYKGEELEYMQQMGSRTAKQTWWFFDKRLKEPLEYSFQHVYIDYLKVYVGGIKQLPSGKYSGKVNLDLPHDEAFNETNEEIVFDSAEIDDWFMVDKGYLLGGFMVRVAPFEEQRELKKFGHFNIPHQSINEDFIESSRVITTEEEAEKTYYNSLPPGVFPGGSKGLRDSAEANLEYSEFAYIMAIEGYVTIRFSVDKAGRVNNLVVLRGVGGGLNESTKNAVKKMITYFKPVLDDNGFPYEYTCTQVVHFSFASWEQTFYK